MLILLHVQMLCRHFIDHDLFYSVFAKLDLAIMYHKLRNLLNIQALIHVDTLKEMSIQLRNLWRDFYQGRNLWSDGQDF